MKAGRLRRVINVERKAPTKSATGAIGPGDWSVLHASVRAEILPVSGREFAESQQVKDAADYKVRIRYIAGLRAEDRVVELISGGDDLVYDIVAEPMNVRGRDRELLIMCRRVT